MVKFKDLQLADYLIEAVHAIDFSELTTVQEAVIPQALAGKDLIVQSQTGSGKSHSFLLPILNQIDPELKEVQAVITAPSRELAEQLYEVARQLVSFSPHAIQLVNYMGGTDKERQIHRLENQGQPQVVIGTPGRIFDLMSDHALWVQTCRHLVVDEADMTMDLGFLSIVDEIASRMPENLQIMVFSATIPQQLEVFLQKYMKQPQTIEIEVEEVLAPSIKNYLINTKGQSRKELTYDLLTMGHPFLALVFCNTIEYANEVSRYLKKKGLKVATIHGDIEPRERRRVMRQIRQLEFQYVVATDLAARGIDIPGISMVINTELPTELEFFIHRVGRTGRNELEGEAFTMMTPDDDELINQLEAQGVEFEEVQLHKGQLKPANSRHQRQQRVNRHREKDDPEISKLIGRNRKKKVKPGYKRKLNFQIKEVKKRKAKQAKRQRRRK